VYPDDRVVRYIQDHFIPARVHVKHQADDFRRFGERYQAQWTPTILILGPESDERHRIEGFLDRDEFLAQLALGLARNEFKDAKWPDAERRFEDVVAQFPNTEAAAEALYWAGVSRYKATNDNAALADTARAFRQRYQDSVWAKKSSVWAG
jgi:hypothetical protein